VHQKQTIKMKKNRLKMLIKSPTKLNKKMMINQQNLIKKKTNRKPMMLKLKILVKIMKMIKKTKKLKKIKKKN
jgi:hypothetical protein